MTRSLPVAGTEWTWRNIYQDGVHRKHDGHLVTFSEGMNILDDADPKDLGAEVVCQMDGGKFTAFAEELGYSVTGPQQVNDETSGEDIPS